MSLTETQFTELLDETLYVAFQAGERHAPEVVDAQLDGWIAKAARDNGLQPSASDRRTVAALAYEQLTYR